MPNQLVVIVMNATTASWFLIGVKKCPTIAG
jgi:hypothetical protein